jgi:hypothetical protein
VSSVAQEELNKLFLKLNEWRQIHDSHDIYSFETFAHLSLHIAHALVDDRRLAVQIGKYLHLLTTKKNESLQDELGRSFIILEHGLEASLRGFSNLLNWVLEENVLGRDPSSILKAVPNLDKKIADRFLQLSDALSAYFDLDEAFLLKTPKTLVLLFLHSLTGLYDDYIKDNPQGGKLLIKRWLKERVPDQTIKSLYESAQRRHKLSWVVNPAGPFAKELLLFMVCLKIAQKTPVTKNEANTIDETLNKFGMLGLCPLLDSGFLSMEQEGCDFGTKISRIRS